MKVLVYTAQMNEVKEAVCKLQEFVKENYNSIAVETVDTQDVFAGMVSEGSYDVIFYALSGGKSREEVASELQSFRLQCPECDVLLFGETEKHAIVGYRIHAYDYIALSEEKEGLIPSFMRIMKEKYADTNMVYSVRIKGVWRRLESKDIVYMETNDHHVLFHMENGQVYKKLTNFNRLTPPIESNSDLFQCHKSYVVNGRYIQGMMQNSFTMSDGKKISISKPNRKSARNFYSQCMMKGYLKQECKKRP